MRKGDKVEAFIRSFSPTPTSLAAASGREHWWAVTDSEAREDPEFSVQCVVVVDAMVHLRSMANREVCGFFVQTGDAYNERPLFRLVRDGSAFGMFFAR